MALTKHQKLARTMKRFSDDLDTHYQKTASMLNVLQLHFYETHLIIGRSLMSEKTLGTMMRTHRWAMERLSPNPDLRSAAQNSPLIGCVLSPPIYLRSRVLVTPPDASPNEKLAIPWGVKTVLPQENLRKLEEAKLEGLLYCASETEMSSWIDWYEQEDKASSFTNQLLAAEKDFREKTAFYTNIRRQALPFYLQFTREYFKTPKDEEVSDTLKSIEFAPRETTDLETAYRSVSAFLAEHKKRFFEDFQRSWHNKLLDLMFEGMSWKNERRNEFLEEYFGSANTAKPDDGPRWETGNALDRQTYGVFIRFFLDRFIEDPIKRQAEGEIALLLWIMIYAARDLEKPIAIKKLLALTTAQINDMFITLDAGEIELSCGLADLINDYAGKGNLKRQQKLFPNLTIDRLEDHLRRASDVLLPPGAIAALPEAFLTFPHTDKNRRLNAKFLRQHQKNLPEIFHDPVSFKELKRQLVEKSKPRSS
jgi:hypothetical protein